MSSSQSSNKTAYRHWCASGKDIPVFHQPWWLDAVCGEWDVALARHGGEIAGAWPYPLEQRLGIRMSRNPLLAPYLGPFSLMPPDIQPRRRAELEGDFQKELISALPPVPVWAVALRPGVQEVGLYTSNGFSVSARQTYYLDIESGQEDEMLQALKTDVRRSLRHTGIDCVITDEPDALADFYRMQSATLSRRGSRLGYSYGMLERAFSAARKRGQTALWAARREGRIVAMHWCVWDTQHAYNLGLSRVEDKAGAHAPSALLWHSILHSRGLGLRVFDFEGSMMPGVESFFRGFGGEKKLYLSLHKNSSLLWRAVRAIRS